MKSLLESIRAINEQKFEGIVDNIKALFCYDRLNNIQKVTIHLYMKITSILKTPTFPNRVLD